MPDAQNTASTTELWERIVQRRGSTEGWQWYHKGERLFAITQEELDSLRTHMEELEQDNEELHQIAVQATERGMEYLQERDEARDAARKWQREAQAAGKGRGPR
jgi:hypothetical protein